MPEFSAGYRWPLLAIAMPGLCWLMMPPLWQVLDNLRVFFEL
jgi:hypothetical protein